MKSPVLFLFFCLFCINPIAYSFSLNDQITDECENALLVDDFKVELVEFVAKKTKNKEIIINWVTASNQTNSHFYVEHSTSGRNFFTIGKIEVTEKNAKTTNYSFLHKKPSANKNYYRLRQVNPDGTFSFSEIRMANFNKEKSVYIYQNPNGNEINIVLDSPSDKVQEINITDLEGEHLHSNHLESGAISKHLDISFLPLGHYQVSINDENGQTKHLFIKS